MHPHQALEQRPQGDRRRRAFGIDLPLLGRGLAVGGETPELHAQGVPAPGPLPADGETIGAQAVQVGLGRGQVQGQIHPDQIEGHQDEDGRDQPG